MNVPYLDLPAQIRSIRPALDAAIARTLDTCSFCLGPDVVQFEKAFAAYVGSKHCIGFNSGTSALHVAMRILDVGPGDEVITTPFTFIATSWAIDYVGAKPVYVDIDEQTMNLDVRLLEKAITTRTKAVMPVHLFGHPFDVDPVLEICRRHGLPLVEDAAQAHGATYKGKTVGAFGVMSGFSFYPGKNLGACGEGGALLTDRSDFAKRAANLREHGSSVRYFHDEVGYNYRMEGIQGAVLSVKLKYLDAWNAARRLHAASYQKALGGVASVLAPKEMQYARHVYHVYAVRTDGRERLMDKLAESGIACGVHYPVPIHMQHAYAGRCQGAGCFPVAERCAREFVSLPMFPELTEEQIAYVGNELGRHAKVPSGAR